MPTLTLEGSGVVVDLDELTGSEEGAQAVAGITGFGLPPVSVQWAEGAGDGARWRGRRVLPRDIDLPLTYYSSSRASLQAMVRKLATAMSGEAIIRLTEDDGSSRTVRTYRTGGGDFTYGTDTDGRRFLKIVVTLRAGDPFWESSTERGAVYTASQIPTTLTIENEGTADAFPVWKIHGPGLNFKLTSPRGEVLHYADFIPTGGVITIDTRNGTVLDAQGINRYASLGSAPRFFSLPPGRSDVAVEYDRSSDAFLTSTRTGRTNYVTTPLFKSGSGAWDLRTPWSYDAAAQALVGAAVTDSFAFPDAEIAIAGLTPGQTYQVMADLTVTYADSRTAPATPTYFDYSGISSDDPAWVSVIDTLTGTELVKEPGPIGPLTTVSKTFTASASTVTLRLRTSKTEHLFTRKAGVPPYLAFPTTTIVKTNRVKVDNVFLGEPGAFFTGDTPSRAGVAVSWTGTPDASTSREVTDPDTSKSSLSYAFNPRDWMVI